MLSSDYPEVDFVDFAVFEDSNTTQVTIGLKQGTSQYPDSLRIAEEAIRYLNDIIRTQDFSIAESADDYYGGYWDERDMELQVYQVQDMFDPGNYYVFQLIEHGSNGPVAPQIMDRVKESLAELSESAQSDK